MLRYKWPNKFAKLLVCLPNEYVFALCGLCVREFISLGMQSAIFIFHGAHIHERKNSTENEGKWRWQKERMARRKETFFPFFFLLQDETDKTIRYKQILMMTFQGEIAARWGMKKICYLSEWCCKQQDNKPKREQHEGEKTWRKWN